jgi:hypothetical protein
VADVQVTVGLGREPRLDPTTEGAGLDVGPHQVADDIEPDAIRTVARSGVVAGSGVVGHGSDILAVEHVETTNVSGFVWIPSTPWILW